MTVAGFDKASCHAIEVALPALLKLIAWEERTVRTASAKEKWLVAHTGFENLRVMIRS
jgi:hypothetical protein